MSSDRATNHSSDQEAEHPSNLETIAVLVFGVGARNIAFASRQAAIRWFKKWMTSLDSSLQQILQFKTSLEKNGWSLKVRFCHMEGSDLGKAVEAFTQLTGTGGSVQIMSDENVAGEILRNEVYKQRQSKQAIVCGDYAKTSAVVDRLSQYFGRVGEHGPSKRQRQRSFALAALSNRSHLIGSATLREARVEDDDDEDEDH
jgi:hypothetical protein